MILFKHFSCIGIGSGFIRSFFIFCRSTGGVRIFKALTLNASLRILDLSFNSIGIQSPGVSSGDKMKNSESLKKKSNQIKGEESDKVEKKGNKIPIGLKEAFNKLFCEENLLHLDLSHNKLNESTCKCIGKGLKENQALHGIHLLGNDAQVDAEGFLQIKTYSGPMRSKTNLSKHQFFKRISTGLGFVNYSHLF
jgi:hypothetical protein